MKSMGTSDSFQTLSLCSKSSIVSKIFDIMTYSQQVSALYHSYLKTQDTLKAYNELKYFYGEQAELYADDMTIWNDFVLYHQRKICLLRYPQFKDEIQEVKGINFKREEYWQTLISNSL